jgi:uncharacterized protein (TIGR00299 family) protein
MNLGALLDLGIDRDYLERELSKLPVSDEFSIRVKKDIKMGITGTKVDVVLNENHHNHHHHERHEHRNLKSIYYIIEESPLNDSVKTISKKIFLTVAEAEAKVHGKPLEEVHFHEVGAVDSIVDIVGAAVCLDFLKVDKIIASTVELGGGFVHCAHGTLPVPAPATIEILQGVPAHRGRVDSEATTPTGAAILKAMADAFSDDICLNMKKTGYGLGTKDFPIPNVLRVFLADSNDEESDYIITENIMLETNIDDMNPEMLAYIEEKLFEHGALDVYRTPIVMKKGRLAAKISVLTDNASLDGLEHVLLHETSTLGIRMYRVRKKMFHRRIENISTKYGDIPIKMVLYKGDIIKYKAEYDQCRQMAVRHGVPIHDIYSEIDIAYQKNCNKKHDAGT